MIETLKAFGALREEFVELSLRHNPVAATLAGIHDYDGILPDDSPDGVLKRAAWLRDFDQRLAVAVPWEKLPAEQRVDFALLRSKLAAMRADLEEIRVHERNPSLFPETALNGIFLLMARPFAPLEERKEMILSRLMEVGDYLIAARLNLKTVPPIFRDTAIEVTTSAPGFVDGVAGELIRSFPDEAERIEHAASRARVGFIQYQEFLDRDLKGKLGGSFAIGERWMNYKLEREHMLSLDCRSLEELGREHVARTRATLEAEARRIDPARSWQEQVTEGKKRHPESRRLREAYVAEVERARRFVEQKRIAPMVDSPLEIIDTPVFERPTTPYAAYLSPAPFDHDQTGYFYVTPVDLSRPKEEQAQQLEGHNALALPLTVVHEAFPGHHLQLSHSNRGGSRLRRLADSALLAEGWALYCEELMVEQGYHADPLTRLFQLKDLLWRACRIVIDVGLHTGSMSFGQAVDYLVAEALLERVNAVTEVRRYAATPTQPMSYLVGKLQLLELREEAKRRLGSGFTFYDFHAAVLASGSVPPSLLRQEIWERLSPAPA
ncbi:MAG TPA: DUF885 domain-containing protein [Candidatus Eisenbacteria bacterium]|jgi:uncharacterized protein (DUF885 family)